MTADEFRAMALSFPGAVEAAHMGHPDFRVKGKIFATIWPDDEWGMVKLTSEEQRKFVEEEPKIFSPVKGGWGRGGATSVRLAAAKKRSVRKALSLAWRGVGEAVRGG